MIKFSVYLNEDQALLEGIQVALDYAKSNRLFCWRVMVEARARFTELNTEPVDCVHCWLVTERELGHLLHEEKIVEDEIPF